MDNGLGKILEIRNYEIIIIITITYVLAGLCSLHLFHFSCSLPNNIFEGDCGILIINLF